MEEMVYGPERWEEMEDDELVQHAHRGERAAFGELVRRHRAEVYGYARSITREAYLAEDIVQDALIRAFMHLGKLVDPARFLPWVHRIVRNQAYTRLKAKPFQQEKTFTEVGALHAEGTLPDPGDIDGILRRLNRSAHEAVQHENVPEERLIKHETLRVLTDIIQCLKPRERAIFESHFFDQLSPAEIARLFNLSSSNVYQILSRSWKKVVQENLRVTVDTYIKTRRDLRMMAKKILPYEGALRETRTWTSAADATYKLLQFTDRKLSLPMVMGLTGHAFRINIIPGEVHIAGPTAYKFTDGLPRGLHNLGIQARYVEGMSEQIGPNTNLMPADLKDQSAMSKRSIHQTLPQALDLIHSSLNRGYPVLAWDLFFPEFGVIFGYDDEDRVLYAEACGRVDTLPYDHLGRSVLEEIFVLAIEGSADLTLRQQLRRALETAIELYEGRESVISTAVRGLDAYQAWAESLMARKVEPNGHAFNIAVIRDARYYAAEFFAELMAAWPEEDMQHQELTTRFGNARMLYSDMLVEWNALHAMFPFPDGGQPNGEEVSLEAMQRINLVLEMERQALGELKAIAALLE